MLGQFSDGSEDELRRRTEIRRRVEYPDLISDFIADATSPPQRPPPDASAASPSIAETVAASSISPPHDEKEEERTNADAPRATTVRAGADAETGRHRIVRSVSATPQPSDNKVAEDPPYLSPFRSPFVEDGIIGMREGATAARDKQPRRDRSRSKTRISMLLYTPEGNPVRIEAGPTSFQIDWDPA
jgi:hypothetical protein